MTATASNLGSFRGLLGADGLELLNRLDEIVRDPEREGTAEGHEAAYDLATWVLLTYRPLLRDAPAEGPVS